MLVRCLVLSLVVAVAGCSPGAVGGSANREKTYPATGVVLLDGAPVAGATVTFRSKGLELTAYGRTNDEGEFTLTTYDDGDGAPAGDYAVAVEKVERIVIQESTNPAMPSVSEVISRLPKKYATAEESGLTQSIAAEGENRLEIPLASK